MDFLRNKEVRLQIMLCIGVTVIGSVLSYFFCMKFYWVTFLTGCAITAISLIFTYRRYMKISSLSQDIDRLLHGEESIRFDDYGEGELAVLENEISKMTLRLLAQSGQLQKDKKYLADSLADISHQLKTPLTSLEILNAALSQEGIDFEQQSSLLHEQLLLLSRMEWLIDVLLKLSRLDAGTIKFENKSFPVEKLVQQATAPFDIMLDIKNIKMDISDIEEIQLYGDIKWLAEALSNVVKNCIESTPDGGQVKISVEENAMYVKLCVIDSGTGIAEEDIPHLFERFYRGKNSGKNGAGIGLALAKAIITQQNGRIIAENTMPCGAKFTIFFDRGVA